MLSVDGYTVWDRIHNTRHSEVFTGLRDSDDLRVILKVYRSRTGEPCGRAEHELQLLERIDSSGVVRPVELAFSGEVPVLVVERVAGYPLSRLASGSQLPIKDFLTVGLGAARALADVHDARVIHKDIKLSNILVDPDRMHVCLIDFGIATEFGRAEQTAPPQTAEGTMHYIAPEQTGRMGLGVDFRTDLYSLGASLYELLTGRPPFRAKNTADLVCAHMAQKPKPAIDVVSSVPMAISRIVDKLLQKDPELRYQTARGLVADLEHCAKSLELEGEIDDDMELGSQDVSDRLRFSSRLYGREHEVSELARSFEKVRRGGSECLLLAGPAGIGKSTLPGTLREPLVRAGGYLAEAKFDSDRRERPYGGIASALEALLSQLLASSAQSVSEWAECIRSQVGAVGGALLHLAPSLRHFVSDFPPAPSLGAREERERLSLALRRLVAAIAGPAHPLVLFFDDLQWADAGSLELLAGLASDHPPETLMLICGFRDDEIAANPAAQKLVDELTGDRVGAKLLTLPPLGPDETAELLADTLGRSTSEIQGLARRVGPKSQHNPLLIRRLMFHLWDRDLIRYQHGAGWVWDERQLTEAEITDDAAAMVAARIDALADGPKSLIKTASLIGTAFEVEMLVTLSSIDRLDVLQELMKLVELGLIAPCRDGFKFVHDRIREAALSRIAPAERAELHRHAASILLENTPADALPTAAFQLADHLIGAAERLDESGRRRALEILLLAGTQSLAQGASDSATHYLDMGRSLVVDCDWEDRCSIVFNLHIQGAQAALQCGKFDSANRYLDAVEPHGKAPIQFALVVATRVSVWAASEREGPLDLALAGLRQLGVRWPRDPSYARIWFEMWKTDRTLRGRIDECAFPEAAGVDPSQVAPMLIMRAAAARSARESIGIACLMAAYALRWYAKHGRLSSPALGIMAYANGWITLMKDSSRAQHYANIALTWTQKRTSPPVDVRAEIGLLTLLEPWFKPRRKLLRRIELAGEAARELGDIEYTGNAIYNRAALGAHSGLPLDRIIAWLRERSNPRSSARIAAIYRMLQQESVSREVEGTRIVNLLDPTDTHSVYTVDHAIAAFCFLGWFELAASESNRFQVILPEAGGLGSRIADLTLYSGIASAVLTRKPGSWGVRRRHARIASSARRRLQAWARFGPDFAHMAKLLEAVVLHGNRRIQPCIAAYKEAANQAQHCGYVHHAAFAHEHLGYLLLESNRKAEAKLELNTAGRFYKEWGARVKVTELAAHCGEH